MNIFLNHCFFSSCGKIRIRRLLAEDDLLASLPGPFKQFILFKLFERLFQWLARLSFPSQLRDSGGIAPLSVSYSCFARYFLHRRSSVSIPHPWLSVFRFRPTKNPQSSGEDWGLTGIINPHRILTPKTVRETSRQVFWLSHPCQPSHPDISGQWLDLTEINGLALSKAGITAAGPLPILTGFPSPGCGRSYVK